MQMSGILWLSSVTLALGIVSGCGTGAPETRSSTNDAATAESVVKTADSGVRQQHARPAGLVASIDSPVAAAEKDGSGSNPENSRKSPFPDDEATKTLREIQQLRISPVPTDLAEDQSAPSHHER
jgi:hypothetical protein